MTGSAFHINLKAGKAFGSGAHPSTEGALQALLSLKEQGREFANVLDMGCGSGILSITAAMLWPAARILAVDIEPEALTATRENALENHVADRLQILRAQGYHDRRIKERSPYDLVLCNILAEPLIAMAADLSEHTAEGGTAVLSGILAWLEADVLRAHQLLGLALLHSVPHDDWRTLLMQKSSVSA